MRETLKASMGGWRNVTLSTARHVMVYAPLWVGLIIAPRQLAQAPGSQSQIGAGEPRAFEAVSIKRNTSESRRASINLGQPGGRVLASNVPLRMLLVMTYQLPTTQILGAPNWIDSEHFDIQAEAEGNPTADQKRLMLQLLLADRFKLVAHHETRELPVYALVVAKPGKLGTQLVHSPDETCPDTQSSSAGTTLPGAGKPPVPCGGISVAAVPGGMQYRGDRLTVEQFIKLLSGANPTIDRPIIDRTGLSGVFDVTLEFAPLQPSPDAGVSDPSALPSIFTALQEQLGLKLQSQMGPVDVLVVDHVEQPSSN